MCGRYDGEPARVTDGAIHRNKKLYCFWMRHLRSLQLHPLVSSRDRNGYDFIHPNAVIDSAYRYPFLISFLSRRKQAYTVFSLITAVLLTRWQMSTLFLLLRHLELFTLVLQGYNSENRNKES